MKRVLAGLGSVVAVLFVGAAATLVSYRLLEFAFQGVFDSMGRTMDWRAQMNLYYLAEIVSAMLAAFAGVWSSDAILRRLRGPLTPEVRSVRTARRRALDGLLAWSAGSILGCAPALAVAIGIRLTWTPAEASCACRSLKAVLPAALLVAPTLGLLATRAIRRRLEGAEGPSPPPDPGAWAPAAAVIGRPGPPSPPPPEGRGIAPVAV